MNRIQSVAKPGSDALKIFIFQQTVLSFHTKVLELLNSFKVVYRPPKVHKIRAQNNIHFYTQIQPITQNIDDLSIKNTELFFN